MEKILKTLDTLKMPSLPSFDSNVPESINSAVIAAGDAVKTKKKERISHCIAVTDSICSGATQQMSDYPKILEGATDVLFQLCDDQDSDIRLVANDCLNRVVRSVKDQYQHRLQMELYKEIKKNQSPRSLRVALKLFAFMCPSIRPQKCRVFMASLLPCLTQISKRTEESLYEYIPQSISDIFKTLGPFVNDNEVKILCKDFLVNLESSSAIIRRSSAAVLVYICQYSRKPHVFLPKLLKQLIDMLVPNLMEKSIANIIGALMCTRQCIEPLSEQLKLNFEKKSPDFEAIVLNLVQVYEMCMILCNHDDHNVVTTALDTLQQLLSHPVERLVQKLISPAGIVNSLDGQVDVDRRMESHVTSSRCSLSVSEVSNFTLEGDGDVPTIRNCTSSVTSEFELRNEDVEFSLSEESSRRNSEVFINEQTFEAEDQIFEAEIIQSDDESQARKFSLSLHNFAEVQIGSLYESNVPLHYCARFLCYNFLLSGRTGVQRTEKEVRISVKVLAMNCLMHVLNLCPGVFYLTISRAEEVNDPAQRIEEVTLYLNHVDPLLRGSTAILLGNLIVSFIRLQGGPQTAETISKYVPRLVDGLSENSTLYETSNISIKCAITALSKCVLPILRSTGVFDTPMVENLIDGLMAVTSNPYWLVKADVLDLLAQIEWELVPDYNYREAQVINTISQLVGDEDHRVRAAASNALIKFVGLGNMRNLSMKASVLCKHCVIAQACTSAPVSCECSQSRAYVNRRLELVLTALRLKLRSTEDKNGMVGRYQTLSLLSEKFPPRMHEVAWLCENANEIPRMFHTVLDTLRSSTMVHDAIVHQNMLTLGANLFLGIISNAVVKRDAKTEGNVFVHPSSHVCAAGVLIIHHCISILKIYHNIVESSNVTSQQQPKKLISPPASPVKKLTPKVDSEKKQAEGEPEKKVKNLVYVVLSCSSHMKKVREVLQQSWKVYKSNLESAVSTRFIGLLEAAFTTLHHMFEHVQSDFTGLATLIDEILAVSLSVFHLCPNHILGCVQQMLRCIFKLRETQAQVIDYKLPLLYKSNSVYSLEDFVAFSTSMEKTLNGTRRSIPLKTQSEKSMLSGFIRQFEPVVVNALRVYTTTSNISIQADILRLLSCLIKGHVNYGLIDKNQVFLGFVIKQVGFLEEGHINNDGVLVEEIFEFFTLLAHEGHHQSSRFIDVPKVMRLCDGLVVSGQNPVTHSLPALKRIVYDLFIERSYLPVTNAEKKELEFHRDTLVQVLVKLVFIPETISILWMVLESRRYQNELQWLNDSNIIASVLLPAIENGELVITERHHICSLSALLFCLAPEVLIGKVSPVSFMDIVRLSVHINPLDFMPWQLHTTMSMLLLAKSCSKESDPVEIGLIFEVVNTHLNIVTKILRSPSFVHHHDFVIYLFEVFLDFVEYYVHKAKKFKLIEEKTIDAYLTEEFAKETWPKTLDDLSFLVASSPNVHRRFSSLLSSLSNIICIREPRIIGGMLQVQNIYREQMILSIVQNAVRDGDAAVVVVMIKQNFQDLLRLVSDLPGILEVTASSELAVEVLAQIDLMLTEKSFVADISKVRNALLLLSQMQFFYPLQVGLRALELVLKVDEPQLRFEAAFLSSRLFTTLSSDSIHVDDCEAVQEYLKRKDIQRKCPRLTVLLKELVNKFDSEPTPKTIEASVMEWCCADLSNTEGTAVADLLTASPYHELTIIFKQSSFNVSILSNCLDVLGRLAAVDGNLASQFTDLFNNDNRSALVDVTPLGVATFEALVDLLEKWERYSPSDVGVISEDISLMKNLRHLWKSLKSVLRTKNRLLTFDPSNTLNCSNNYIPTEVFMLSFEIVGEKCRHHHEDTMLIVEEFFSFAASALQDPCFMSFFNNSENISTVLNCVNAMHTIVKFIIRECDLVIAVPAEGTEPTLFILNENLRTALSHFSFISQFVSNLQRHEDRLDASFTESITVITAGLGRCDALNMWILMSHLDWKPPVSESAGRYHMPSEIFQNDANLLHLYVEKLKVVGIANKTQFEENWMAFLAVINCYGDDTIPLQLICTGLRTLSMVLEMSVRFTYTPKPGVFKSVQGIEVIKETFSSIEPPNSKAVWISHPFSEVVRIVDNPYGIDFNSCIRLLVELFSQWLHSSQSKMPLLLLSEVVQSIVRIADYFEDTQQYTWMFDTLLEIYKSFEKEDEVLWPHLVFGMFYAASKISVEPETMNYLVQVAEGSLTSSSVSVSIAGIQSCLYLLQHNPATYPVLNVVTPYVLKQTHLAEIEKAGEEHSCAVWQLLLFLWIHGPSDSIGVASFDQETLSNILTVLSPLNKVFVSVRLLALKGLQEKILRKSFNPDSKRNIGKVMQDMIKSKNNSVFCESLKLFTIVFYTDFEDVYRRNNPEPEAFMQLAERLEFLFKLMKTGNKYCSIIISKVLPHIMTDFLPPSEILNRVVAEFLSPQQNTPELLALLVVKLLLKAQKRPKEAALVREWVISSIPNFLSNPDFTRTSWSLTIFFIGVSTNAEFRNLLPFAQLRKSCWSSDLFVLSATDFYASLTDTQKNEFLTSLRMYPVSTTGKNPYGFLEEILQRS